MNIVEDTKAGIPIVRIKSPRIDAACAAEFRESLTKLVDRGLTRFVLDLSAVTFVDSTGLGALVSALKVTGRQGGIAISGARDSVATLFKITRMDKVFRLFATDDEAAKALASMAA